LADLETANSQERQHHDLFTTEQKTKRPHQSEHDRSMSHRGSAVSKPDNVTFFTLPMFLRQFPPFSAPARCIVTKALAVQKSSFAIVHSTPKISRLTRTPLCRSQDPSTIAAVFSELRVMKIPRRLAVSPSFLAELREVIKTLTVKHQSYDIMNLPFLKARRAKVTLNGDQI
jgi:hypothetical protein